MIQSYKQKPLLQSSYDVIIIGSGPAGFTAGVMLAKEGKKVLILERHYEAGGYTHVFKRKGYEWDVGVHYIGEMGRKNSFGRKLMDYVTNKGVEWADMGDIYDRVRIGDEQYDFVKGTSNLKKQLISYFPEEEKAILSYFNLVFKTVKASRGYFLDKALPSFLRSTVGFFLRRKFLSISKFTTYEVLSGLTKNEKLIKVLTAQWGDYGLPPEQSSFGMHAALVKHYFAGGYYPIGGASVIVQAAEKVLEENGGTILISAEVDQILLEGNTAVGIRMADGKEFKAPIIISTTGVFNTFNKLLPNFSSSENTERFKNITPSTSHMCLYVGLDGTVEDLKLPKSNYWIYPKDLSHDQNIKNFAENIENDFPVVYISFPSSKDPNWKQRYPDKCAIDIITMLPYEQVKQWEDSRWQKRGEAYDAFKEKLAARLLEALYRVEPQLKGKVSYYELSTPLTTVHFMNYGQGEIYGIDHTPKRFHNSKLVPKTEIHNFYLSGQDIVTVGIAGAMASGLLTASSIMGKNLMKKVL